MNKLPNPDNREILLNIFSRALPVVSGRHCVTRYLYQNSLPAQRMRVIAIGKAAASMAQGALDACLPQIDAMLIITKEGYREQFDASTVSIEQLETGHPLPDERSIRAGKRMLDFITETPIETGLLFLISGGASSLVEVLPPGISIAQLMQLNQWLLAKGWPIEIMNQIRKSVSLLKAGRLLSWVKGHAVLQLLISDVPGDDISVIGSGMLVPDTENYPVPEVLPEWVLQMQNQTSLTLVHDRSHDANIMSHILASNQRLREEVVSLASAQGYRIQCNEPLFGDAARQGEVIARRLITGLPGVYIWGGETVVSLPDSPGSGGRCQHLALSVAQKIAGQRNLCVLALGTDGSDGPGEVAGAVVDGDTITRASDGGQLNAEQALLRADAGQFLAASGDLVDTGPTGTNVMDLIIGLKT